MAASLHENMLEKVKRTFLHMTSPSEFGGAKSFENIVTMNVPPMTACADAAYERLFEIVHRDLFMHSTEDERAKCYVFLRELAADARDTAMEIERVSGINEIDVGTGVFIEYMNLIIAVLDALIPMAAVQARAVSANPYRRDLPGGALAAALRAADVLCGDSELALFHFLRETLDSLSSAFDKFREPFRKNFSKSDQERYAKAREEFIDYYRKAAEK